MIWKNPHISKIYEALTAIADSRIELESENKAKCYSSSKGKYYEIEYDPQSESIMSNDNTAYYTDSISYPMIALLMLKGKLTYNPSLLEILKGIFWKNINQKFNNDYDKAIEYVLNDLVTKGADLAFIHSEINKIYDEAINLKLNYLGTKSKPSSAY